MIPPALSPAQWLLAAIAALCIGLSKTGFVGVSMVTVVVMAAILPARESTGVVLPMLIFADLFAVRAFRQHAVWPEIRRVLPAALLGVMAGAFIMQQFGGASAASDVLFKRIIGGIVLVLTLLQYVYRAGPAFFGRLPPHHRPFAWAMGGLAGITTMLANASGPVVSMYFLTTALPKMELVGTSAWIFLLLNLAKTPFSYHLGLINGHSLALNLYLFPVVAVGVFSGRWLLQIVPQRLFEELLLFFALLAAIKLLLG